MNYFTTSLMKNRLTNENNLLAFEEAVSELFRSELEKAINEILEHELTVFLDYERYARSENPNYRNGFYQRKFNTKYGVLKINMPRDRFGEFFCTLLPRYQRHDHSIDKTIIDLFSTGLSNADISKIVQSLCGATYSKQTVSNITDKCIETIDAFKKRPLSKEYAVVYTDATCMVSAK